MHHRRSFGPAFLLKFKAFAMLLAMGLGINLFSYKAAQSVPQSNPAAEKVFLTEAARHFGIATSWKPAKGELTLTYRGHAAQIFIGSNNLTIDGRSVIISSPVIVSDGAVSISVADSMELFSRLLGRRVTKTEIYSAGLVSSERSLAGVGNLVENVRFISYPRFTRLILSVSGYRNTDEIEVKCFEGTNTLTIALPGARFLQLTPPIEVGDRIVDLVESLQTSGGAQVIARTIPGSVKYEIQKHPDPLRVVIDVQPADPSFFADTDQNFLTPSLSDTRTEPTHKGRRFQLTTIVIDPGHGGKDLGASGRGGVVEKDITLDIALKLKELIEKGLGIKVVLTRTGDEFVSLKERTIIANSAKDGTPADLFISIHVNSHMSPKVEGFEAYYVSDAVDSSAAATAAAENSVVELEEDANGPIESSLAPILWDLQFTEFISESSELALMAQEELANRLSTRNRGVRQARFIVLSSVAMPSILVEVAYVSNREEELKLKTADFRNKCAEALSAAVADFKQRHDVAIGFLNRE